MPFMSEERFRKSYTSDKTVINCKTEELARIFLKEANAHGYRWSAGSSCLNRISWDNYGENTCYNLGHHVAYSSIGFYKSRDCTIIDFKGFYKTNERI